MGKLCDYEGSAYRTEFWEGQGRDYEDAAERIALGKLLPPEGDVVVEVGAGFGRLVELYDGYRRVILVDHSRSLLAEARERWGEDGRFVFVAADLHQLPLVDGAADTLVTVRVLHHVSDVPVALSELARVVAPGGCYVLEYANKRNLKELLRWLVGRSRKAPFSTLPTSCVMESNITSLNRPGRLFRCADRILNNFLPPLVLFRRFRGYTRRRSVRK